MTESVRRLARDARRVLRQGPTAIRQRQHARLAEIVAFARARSPYYRELYRALPEDVADPALLPVTDKKTLMARFDEWVTDRDVTLEKAQAFVADPALVGERFQGRYLVTTTSGTSGLRGIFLQDERSVAVGNAVGRRVSAGLGAGEQPDRGARRPSHPDQPTRWADHTRRGVAMRIVIAEDDPLLREGVALLLRAESLDVVATTDSPDAFLAAVDAHRPDVAIVDVRMPPTHTTEGIEAAVEARRRQPGLAVLVLSAYVEQAFATELLASGTDRLGYLLKERVGRVGEFLDALHRVAAGGTAIDPEVVAQLLTRTRPDSELERLTARERDVLALMAEGLGNTAVSERLFISEGAVHKHIRSIFAKLDLAPTDRADRRVTAVLRYLEETQRLG